MKRLTILLILLAVSADAEISTRPPSSSHPIGGTMTAPLLAPAANNCAAIPYSFTGDPDTGMCSSVGNTIELWANNTRLLAGRSTSFDVLVPLLLGAGTIFGTSTPSVPSLYFDLGTRRATLGNYTNLTAGAATTTVTVGVPSGTAVGGSLEYTLIAHDAVDSQTRHGSFHFAAGNKGGTETCVLSAASEAADGSVLATTEAAPGTLTYAITCDTSGTNEIALQFNAVSSLTETTLRLSRRINTDCDGSCTVTLVP